jgi:hypothetical protein
MTTALDHLGALLLNASACAAATGEPVTAEVIRMAVGTGYQLPDRDRAEGA